MVQLRIWNETGLSRRLLSSRPARLILISLLAVSFAVLWLRLSINPTGTFRARIFGHPSKKARLHLLVPATSSNPNLCKLLLSAEILGWPTPVLINWGDHEEENEYVQHLAKVEGINRYLQQLKPSSDYVEDLVLVIDGYDIWFQLRPDVLIKRFYEINAAADARVVDIYGEKLARRYDMRQTVVFGPDKICWPVDFSRPACWAVPPSPLPATVFGPPVTDEPDRDRNDARWLNSGTVLGSLEDMREIFSATLDLINTNHTTDSDQFYFANLFGQQEYARMFHKEGWIDAAKAVEFLDPEDTSEGFRADLDIPRGLKTEYHMGIDYYSSMFQTLAFWRQHLIWSRMADSDSSEKVNLEEDISQSTPPPKTPGGNSTSWADVQLAYNVITKQHPVLLHVTGSTEEKEYRNWWWPKLWFQEHAQRLHQLASEARHDSRISAELIHGMHWFNAEGKDAKAVDRGGAWTDREGWLGWGSLCEPFEEELFAVPDDEPETPTPAEESDVETTPLAEEEPSQE